MTVFLGIVVSNPIAKIPLLKGYMNLLKEVDNECGFDDWFRCPSNFIIIGSAGTELGCHYLRGIFYPRFFFKAKCIH